MKMHYDSRNNNIYCTDAYACKDILKSQGFRFNGMDKSWFIPCPKSGAELGGLLCDVFCGTKMGYYDFCDFLAELPEEIAQAITMDEAQTARFQTAAAATGEVEAEAEETVESAEPAAAEEASEAAVVEACANIDYKITGTCIFGTCVMDEAGRMDDTQFVCSDPDAYAQAGGGVLAIRVAEYYGAKPVCTIEAAHLTISVYDLAHEIGFRVRTTSGWTSVSDAVYRNTVGPQALVRAALRIYPAPEVM